MKAEDLENFYRENLEEQIIFELCRRQNILPEKAMDFYYNSKLATQIYNGEFGIQYLDYKILTDYLEELLFKKKRVSN